MSLRIRSTPIATLLLAAIMISACTDNVDDQEPTGRTDAGLTPAPGDADPNDPDPSTADAAIPSGPVNNLRLWTDGCNRELWGRWTTGEDFSLAEVTVSEVGGRQIARTTYFEQPSFRRGMDERFRIFDEGSFDADQYELDMVFGSQPGLSEVVPVDADFPQTPTFIEITNAEVTNFDGLTLTLDASIEGDIRHVRIYADDTRCLRGTNTFFEPVVLRSSGTELRLGGNHASGTNLFIVVQGANYDSNYSFYSAQTVTVN